MPHPHHISWAVARTFVAMNCIKTYAGAAGFIVCKFDLDIKFSELV